MTTDNILAPIAALTIPDANALSARANQAVEFIQSFQIASAEDYGLAADELKAVKVRINKLESQRTAITGPINAGLKAINDLFRGPASLLSHAEMLLKGKMLAWDQEQERIAAERRRQAEEAAAAERKRLEAEAAARQAEADKLQRQAAEAAAAGDKQAAGIAQANADRAQAEAQVVAETAQMVVAPVVGAEPVKTKGISTSKKVDFEVVDLLALVKHIAAHPELINLVAADSVKLRAYVRGLGMSCQLPGVRVFEERVLSARAA